MGVDSANRRICLKIVILSVAKNLKKFVIARSRTFKGDFVAI
ncbi:hypothetical protein ACWIUD_08780 [Helicobacter sp. 23-1044]